MRGGGDVPWWGVRRDLGLDSWFRSGERHNMQGGTSFASPWSGCTFHHGILPNDINIVLNRLPAKFIQFKPRLQTCEEKK